MKRIALLLVAALVVACSSKSSTSTSTPSSSVGSSASPAVSHPPDISKLPVGDGKLATTPTVGSIFVCRTGGGGGGASAQGPWFNGDGTWDLTKKVFVKGEVTWSGSSATFTVQGDERVITSNDLPPHTTGVFPISSSDPAYQYDRNPNSITSQSLSFSLPATPTVTGSPSCVGGEVGIGLDGVPIFSGFDAGNRDAVAWEVQDKCHGHPQPTGVYHYHDMSPCLDDTSSGHSKLVGYAFDGFGIFGPRGEDGKELSTADLDVCHGHTHAVEWDGHVVEMYHYHATVDFPYTVSCFRGTSAQTGPIGG